MKYSILGFKQDVLVNEYSNLNPTDLIVLRTMVDMLHRLPRTIKVDDKVYIQMTYKMLLTDLPFITESSSTIKRIVQKLIDNNLIERYVVKQKGNYTYFRVTDKLEKLEHVPNQSIKKEEETVDTNEQSEVTMTEEQLMEEIGYGRKEVKVLSNKYGPIDLMEARHYVLDKYRSGTQIKDPVAYLKNVLRQGYYKV